MKKNKWIVALLALALVVGMVAVFAVSCGEGGGDTDRIDRGRRYYHIDRGPGYDLHRR